MHFYDGFYFYFLVIAAPRSDTRDGAEMKASTKYKVYGECSLTISLENTHSRLAKVERLQLESWIKLITGLSGSTKLVLSLDLIKGHNRTIAQYRHEFSMPNQLGKMVKVYGKRSQSTRQASFNPRSLWKRENGKFTKKNLKNLD